MIDFSTNRYIHNIQIKHLHDVFKYEKQLNKTVFIKQFTDRQIKLNSPNWSHSSLLFSLFTTRKLATGFQVLSSLSKHQGHTNKQLSSLADSRITHWFELLYNIPIILYCKHLQHFAKEICSSYPCPYLSLSLD